MLLFRARTQTLQSGVKCTNHEASTFHQSPHQATVASSFSFNNKCLLKKIISCLRVNNTSIADYNLSQNNWDCLLFVRCTQIAIVCNLIRAHNPNRSSHRIQLKVIYLLFKNLDVFVWWSADFRENFRDHKKKEQSKEKRQPVIRHFVVCLVTKK